LIPDDGELGQFVTAIVKHDDSVFATRLAKSPEIARTSFSKGATRQQAQPWFIDEIKRYIVEGDTALHIAAAAYRPQIIQALVTAGADVRARNRLGDEPLHAAAVGSPGLSAWNPAAQVATIVCLIQNGADPNALNKTGVAPLHRAVRTRCAAAVEALIANGADPRLRNKSGSTPMLLATHTTGRGGSGSPEAKDQQQQIIRLLQVHLGA
jgi:ankyrin repeat protein